MNYGIVMWTGQDPRELLAVARDAEAAGRDGLFLWDAFLSDNAWLLLAAIAVHTTHLRLGTMLTAPSRRRPWQLASEVATLDRISDGRAILALGLGAAGDLGFARVGEATDRKVRAELLDESIDILHGLWSGEAFSYSGAHYKLDRVTLSPPPVQSPLPIWVVGAWPRAKSMQRVLRCDGIIMAKMTAENIAVEITPDDDADIRAIRSFVNERRTLPTPFDMVIEGDTDGDDPAGAAAMLDRLADAGVTWWLESAAVHNRHGGLNQVRRRINQGPPRRS